MEAPREVPDRGVNELTPRGCFAFSVTFGPDASQIAASGVDGAAAGTRPPAIGSRGSPG